MAKKKYSFDDHQEHKAKLGDWAARWIANALNTAPMDDADKSATREAVLGLYAAAELPPPTNIVFSSGPVTAAVAASVAAGVWWLREHPDKYRELGLLGLNEEVLLNAIGRSCAAVFGPHKIGALPTRDATSAATDAATSAATSAATDAATSAATRAATYAATRAATEALVERTARFLVLCCGNWSNLRNGGNQWSGWAAYISFFRHVAKLDLPEYELWKHCEAAAVHAGPRFVHAKFCIVADRPEFIRRDAANRPHSIDGPFTRWRDGIALYRVRGTQVPREWIEEKNTIDPSLGLTHPNVEQRRALCEILGWSKIIAGLNAREIHRDHDPEIGTLIEVDLPDAGACRFLKVQCGTGRHFVLPVPVEMKTAREANAWTYNLSPTQFNPEVRT